MAMPMIFRLIDSRIIRQSPNGRANVARMGYLFNLPIDRYRWVVARVPKALAVLSSRPAANRDLDK
jgi:hypothetical protein